METNTKNSKISNRSDRSNSSKSSKNCKNQFNTEWTSVDKSEMKFTYEGNEYIIKINDEIKFKFYNFSDKEKISETNKGSVIGFGWGHDSPPYYLIINRWKEETKNWGIGRYCIKIPGCETGRAVCGIMEL
jgi:hypothetical protein